MNTINSLLTHQSVLPLITVITLIFGIYKYMKERKEIHYWKEFETYHKLVNQLVSPSKETQWMYLDMQAAIIFELRNFKRYHPYSLRMLEGLHQTWSSPTQNSGDYSRLIKEIELSIKFLKSKIKSQ